MPVSQKLENHLTTLVENMQGLLDEKYDELKNSNLKCSKDTSMRDKIEKYVTQALREILFDMSQIKITKLTNLVIETVFKSQKNFDRLVEEECLYLSRVMPFLRSDQIKGQALENAGFKTIFGELDKKALIERYVLNEVTIPTENAAESAKKNVKWAEKVTVMSKKTEDGEKILQSDDDESEASERPTVDSLEDFTPVERNPRTLESSTDEYRLNLAPENKTDENKNNVGLDRNLELFKKSKNSMQKNLATPMTPSGKIRSILPGEEDKNSKDRCSACLTKVVYQFNESLNPESDKKISDLCIKESGGENVSNFEIIRKCTRKRSYSNGSLESDSDAASVCQKINFKPKNLKSGGENDSTFSFHKNQNSEGESSLSLIRECCSCSAGSDLDESEICSYTRTSRIIRGRDSSSTFLDENRSSDKDSNFLIPGSPEETEPESRFHGFDSEDVRNYRNYLLERYITSSTETKIDYINNNVKDLHFIDSLENLNFSSQSFNYSSQSESFSLEKIATESAPLAEGPECRSSISDSHENDDVIPEDSFETKSSENGEKKKRKLSSTCSELNNNYEITFEDSPEKKAAVAADEPKKRKWATTSPELILRQAEIAFDFVPIGEVKSFGGQGYDSFLDGLESSKTAQNVNAVMDFM